MKYKQVYIVCDQVYYFLLFSNLNYSRIYYIIF